MFMRVRRRRVNIFGFGFFFFCDRGGFWLWESRRVGWGLGGTIRMMRMRHGGEGVEVINQWGVVDGEGMRAVL